MGSAIRTRLLAACLLLAGGCSTDDSPDSVPAPAPAPSVGVEDSGGGTAVDAEGAAPADAGSDLACVPSKAVCGKCGTQAIDCIDGKPVAGACMGERDCAPGSSYDSPDGCAVHTCKADCRWDIWRLKPGNQCTGTGVQTCVSTMCSGARQQCMNCKWGPCRCN